MNENGFNDIEEGPGSPGNETKTFGTATRDAIKIFQEYNEMPITGKVDFATGRAINNYIKELEDEESKYENDSEDNIENTIDKYSSIIDNENGIDKYKFDDAGIEKDVTDTHITPAATPMVNDKKTEEKKTLKNLLESSATNENKTTKTPTLFERFFSIFK